MNCDWLALHDLHVVLSSTGLARPWSMVLAMYSLLLSHELPMPEQALHWLWDIVTGFSKPWLCPKEPLEVQALESLRAWLRRSAEKGTPWRPRGQVRVQRHLFLARTDG